MNEEEVKLTALCFVPEFNIIREQPGDSFYVRWETRSNVSSSGCAISPDPSPSNDYMSGFIETNRAIFAVSLQSTVWPLASRQRRTELQEKRHPLRHWHYAPGPHWLLEGLAYQRRRRTEARERQSAESHEVRHEWSPVSSQILSVLYDVNLTTSYALEIEKTKKIFAECYSLLFFNPSRIRIIQNASDKWQLGGKCLQFKWFRNRFLLARGIYRQTAKRGRPRLQCNLKPQKFESWR